MFFPLASFRSIDDVSKPNHTIVSRTAVIGTYLHGFIDVTLFENNGITSYLVYNWKNAHILICNRMFHFRYKVRDIDLFYQNTTFPLLFYRIKVWFSFHNQSKYRSVFIPLSKQVWMQHPSNPVIIPHETTIVVKHVWVWLNMHDLWVRH